MQSRYSSLSPYLLPMASNINSTSHATNFITVTLIYEDSYNLYYLISMLFHEVQKMLYLNRSLFLIQGQRAYAGHKKYITPNKRHMLPFFLKSSLPEPEFNRIIKDLHSDSLGQPELRNNKAGRDVTKYPVPECMCKDSHTHTSK